MKAILKQLHSCESQGIKDKILGSGASLENTQSILVIDHQNKELLDEEKVTIMQLKRWLANNDSVWKQKARLRWLKESDVNSRFLHASIQARNSSNRIDKLVDGQGNTLSS